MDTPSPSQIILYLITIGIHLIMLRFLHVAFYQGPRHGGGSMDCYHDLSVVCFFLVNGLDG